jgi:two-component system chemotaxis response regulator CheY
MNRQLTVMVVDDSILTIKKLEKMLTELGHQVIHTCKTGKEAVSDYPKYMPDMLTMDITMPDMDGIEATKKIIALNPDALIVMVTSHGQEQKVMDAIEAGAMGYVLKPIRKEKLETTIASLE